jgi:hypothetical protein
MMRIERVTQEIADLNAQLERAPLELRDPADRAAVAALVVELRTLSARLERAQHDDPLKP